MSSRLTWWLGLAVLFALVYAGSRTAGAVAAPIQPDIVQGAASVNGENIPEQVKAKDFIPRKNNPGGLSIAGAQIGNGQGQVPGNKAITDYQISSGVVGKNGNPKQRVPSAQESKRLDDFVQAVQALPALKKDDKDARDKALATARDKLFDIGKDAKQGSFPSIAKERNPARVGDFIGAKAGPVSTPAVAETAKSEARQTLTEFNAGGKNPTFSATGRPETSINKLGGIVPVATAFSINRDPMAVEWGRPAQITETLRDFTSSPTSPASLSLTASAAGGARAAAFYEKDVFFRNFSSPGSIPSNLDSLEAGAKPLFQLTMLLLNDGTGVQPFFDLRVNPDASITDSMNRSGQADVLNDIIGNARVAGDTLFFKDDYSFTVTLPYSPESSVLFTDDASAAAVSAVPEPPTLVLWVLGGLAWLGYCCGRRLRLSPSPLP
jgi:hypothetical protein